MRPSNGVAEGFTIINSQQLINRMDWSLCMTARQHWPLFQVACFTGVWIWWWVLWLRIYVKVKINSSVICLPQRYISIPSWRLQALFRRHKQRNTGLFLCGCWLGEHSCSGKCNCRTHFEGRDRQAGIITKFSMCHFPLKFVHIGLSCFLGTSITANSDNLELTEMETPTFCTQ